MAKRNSPKKPDDAVAHGPVPTVELSGKAVLGVGKHLFASAAKESLQSATTARLGRKRPAARPQALRLSVYFDRRRASVDPPAKLDYYTKAAESLSRMYLNDQYGDCVIAGKAHAFGVWSANDKDSGGVVLATDKEILDQYQAVCGPGDQGCYIGAVLDYCKGRGFLAGGKRYKIDGYVAVDWRDKAEVQVAQVLFGATTIGVNLPQAWTESDVWDVTKSRVVGGHDVTVVGYDQKGCYVSSWGRLYLMTWAAFNSAKWVEEYYAMLSPSWYGADKMAPSGVDAKALMDDLEKLGRGELPPLPLPAPPAGGATTILVDWEKKKLTVDGREVPPQAPAMAGEAGGVEV